ncbi:MAG: zf-TFIIB domain-containing protein [Candidatus Saccharimonadales bacterium]
MNNNSSTPIPPIIMLGLACLIALAVFLQRFSLRGRFASKFDPASVPADSQSDSEILSFYTAGHLLTRLAKTTAKGLKYSVYLTLPYNLENSIVTEDAAIVVLDLPFNTQTHLIGLSKQHGIDRVKFDSFVQANGMEKVELEGDFPDFFDIFVAKGQQFQARVVLDPDSMQFVADFCKSHFWEINSSELYLAASSQDKGTDNYIETALKFVDSLKPALLPGEPGAAKVHHEVQYGEYDGPALLCPICQKTMTIHDNWQICPAGHGILVNGKDLTRLHAKELVINPLPANDQKHAYLKCPFCRHQMENVDYEETHTMIDSCTFCTFRWLDANEIAKIAAQ